MNICIIGKHIYPKDIFSNELDLKTWRSLAGYFDKLFVIAQSPDIFFHSGKENNIKIYLLPNILGYFSFIIGAIKVGLYLHWKYGVDCFDASEVVGGGIAATFLKSLTSARTVVEVQGEIFSAKGGFAFGGRDYFLKKIGRFVMKKANRVRVNSNEIFNQVKEQGVSEDKIRLVFLRIDLNLFTPNPQVSETHKIGYVGRLIEDKGLENLLEAIKILGDYKLIIFGSGPLKSKLKTMAQELNIEDKIEWRGFVSYSKVPEALSQIDVFVYPSLHEGFGRAIMEALAMKKAVVATNIGGIPDLIKDGINGFLVEPNNPEMLAEKIKTLMENKELREKFGKAGREYVSKNFEWNEGIKKFANLFLELK